MEKHPHGTSCTGSDSMPPPRPILIPLTLRSRGCGTLRLAESDIYENNVSALAPADALCRVLNEFQSMGRRLFE